MNNYDRPFECPFRIISRIIYHGKQRGHDEDPVENNDHQRNLISISSEKEFEAKERLLTESTREQGGFARAPGK